jgi:predicted transcriptional regulator with HTH domain
MKAKVLFVLLFLFLPVAFAQRYELTNYNATKWQDPYFISQDFGSNYLFVSTYYLNESRYFLFSYSGNYFYVRRLDSFGSVEDTRRDYLPTGATTVIGSDFNWWYRDQLMFLGVTYGGDLYLIGFNVTDYISNSSSTGFRYFRITGGVKNIGDLIAIGSIMSKGYYTDMVANMSFPIIFQTTDGKIYIAYDFYDLDNAAFTPGNMKTIEISTGMSNVKKLYVVPTSGNCFQWSNCLFHVLYEGSSSQNGNRYGIYVREVRRGFFGYEFADRGIMCLAGDALGFQDCVVGTIDKWFYTQSFPSLANRIYYRVITSDNRRIVFVQQYDMPTWVKIDEQVINYHDNNALVPYALGFGRFTTSGTYNFTNITIKNNANVAYIGGLGYTGVSSYNYYCGVIVRVRVCDAFNVSLCSSDVTVGSGGNYGGDVSVPLFGGVPLPSNSSLYTIFIVVDFPGNCIDRYATVYMDVIGSPSKFTVTLASNGVEAFAVSPVGEGTSYFMYQLPSETTCICTEWIYKGCYNSTHEYWTRTCSPTACANEIRFALNESCAAVTTTTTVPGVPTPPIPGAPPGAGYTGGLFNLTGKAIELNITGGALVGITILDRILSLAGIATIISIAVGAALGYITKNGHVAAIGILLLIIFFTLIGFYPWWFGIVFIIIAGLIVTIMFKEAF